MERDELLTALRRLSVETGSLACLGCGHEHGCGVKGCAIMREAIKFIEILGGKIMEGKYCIIRADRAGVFFGKVKAVDGNGVTLTDCRRIWYWSGAASLSQLAKEGVKYPENCKFTVTVDEITVLGVIEIIPCTEAAVENIKAVKEWKIG